MRTSPVGRSVSSGLRIRSIALLMMMALPQAAFADERARPEQLPNSETTTNAASSALWTEPRLLARGIAWIEGFGNDEGGQPPDGFYPEWGHMITGAGWISVGPGYRRHFWRNRTLIDASAALSWRAYKMAQARVEFPALAHDRLVVGGKAYWQDFTQVRYFGTPADSVEGSATDYRVQATDIVAYGTWRFARTLAVSTSVGLMTRPELSSSTGPFDRAEADTMQVFADAPAAALTRQPRFLHGDVGIASDTRDYASYPRRGGLYRAAWTTFHDQSDATLSFDRWEIEAAQFVPVARERGVIALHWWAVLSDTRTGAAVPFYFLPSLGGDNTLRAFANYRFHDRHLIVANLESRWALFPHVDAALFFDAGNVAPRVKDLDFERTSYGLGFRIHTMRTTLARLDIGHGSEGWRFLFKLSDPLRMRRLARRMAALPFVP